MGLRLPKIKFVKAEKKEYTRAENIKAWMGIIGGLIFSAFLGFIIATPFLDHVDVKPVKCHVVAAEGVTRTSSNGKGSTTSDYVLVHTSDCGVVSLGHWDAGSSKDEMAKKFKPGHEYILRMGWTSRHFVPVARSIGLNIIPSIRSFEEVK